MTSLLDIDTPSLILDQDKLMANIALAQKQCLRLGATWRPHLKTHKCLEIARMQVAGPTGPATVSTLKGAEFFCQNGITDIVYAVGIAPHKLPRVDAINRAGGDVKIILDNLPAAQAVSAFCKAHGSRLGVLIEIDCDGHRSGLKPNDPAILPIVRALQDGAVFKGVLTHAGGSYNDRTPDALDADARTEAQVITAVARDLAQAGHPCDIVSAGSTPTLIHAQPTPGVTEYRSGVGTFFDLVMSGIGVCQPADIAISVLVSVIGHQQEKGWVITDGGWLAMSRDRGTAAQALDCGYGLVCDINGRLLPEFIVSGANQEHGIITRRDGGPIDPAQFPLDRRLRILPNHACPTAAAFDCYHVERNGQIVDCWSRFNHW